MRNNSGTQETAPGEATRRGGIFSGHAGVIHRDRREGAVGRDEVRREPACEWVRRDDARRIFGIGKDVLDHWVADDVVEAHKLNPGRNGTVVFSASGIRAAIEAAPRYTPLCQNSAPALADQNGPEMLCASIGR